MLAHYGLKAQKSRPAWDAWIEMSVMPSCLIESLSRPAWDAWIEINKSISAMPCYYVASRMGRVD